MSKPERDGLQLHKGPFLSKRMCAAYDRLLRDVLDLAPPTNVEPAGPWRPFSYFAPDRRCVANVDAAVFPLVLDGETLAAGAVRSVAVDPDWRGKGLFRDLMREALAACDAESALTLLYAEEPAIYRAFGFHEVPQHGFVGPSPASAPGPPARKLALNSSRDAALLRDALARRTPVSMSCALLVDATLFVANVDNNEDIELVYLAEHDAIVLYETDDELLTLVDIVGRVVPDLATILGAMSVGPQRVKTLFPPDRLGWSGQPVVEDTGLMIRGAVPPAMTRPFMFPPTVEF